MEWLNADDDQRPAASADMRTCQSAAWKDVVKHVRAQSSAFGEPTQHGREAASGVVLGLVGQWAEIVITE